MRRKIIGVVDATELGTLPETRARRLVLRKVTQILGVLSVALLVDVRGKCGFCLTGHGTLGDFVARSMETTSPGMWILHRQT